MAHTAVPSGAKALVGGPTSALADVQAANDRDMRVIRRRCRDGRICTVAVRWSDV